MTKIALVLFIQIFTTILLSGILAEECLTDNNKFNCKLSTKTPYRFIANYNDSRLNFPGCTEKKVWLIIRHGTRYPSKKYIKSLKHILPKLQNKIIKSFHDNKSELSSDLIKRFTEWQLSFSENDAMNLAEEGENELIDLAERMQARFPTLLPEIHNHELFRFKHTATQRTEVSAKSFVLGLFGQQNGTKISFPEPEHKDPILRFYKRCQRWKTEIDKNPETYKEKNLFIEGPIVQQLLKDISKRIGVKVDYEKVNFVYMMCAFETAWNKIKSPWCDILTLNDVKILEFIDDLEYYWVDGYGYRLNYDQACAALRDMFTFFESPDKSLTTAYFTHSGTILKILSILGIAKEDKPLTHESYSLHKETRNWKVGLIDAFASNIAFVLYDCEKKGPSALILHQERPVHITGCPPGFLCPMQTMKNIFPDTEQECQFSAMCGLLDN